MFILPRALFLKECLLVSSLFKNKIVPWSFINLTIILLIFQIVRASRFLWKDSNMNKYTQVQPRIHKSQLAEWIVVHFICFVISQVIVISS